MTTEQAGRVLVRLNAGFPRDALEPETAAMWVEEIARLANFEAAEAAATLIARTGERFPHLSEFRKTYRGCAERTAPKELEPELVEMPEDMRKEWLHSRALVQAIPETDSFPERPVMARHTRRMKGSEIDPPSELEKADAIRVLELNNGAPWWLYREAERILEEAAQ